MSTTKDRINRALIGFEQGKSIKTIEQLRSQTRARFSPLGNPIISFSEKKDQKASALLKIDSIPEDPGSGKYNLEILSANGQVLKIRAAEVLAASGKITVNSFSSGNYWQSGTFVLPQFSGPDIKFSVDSSTPNPAYDASGKEPATPTINASAIVQGKIYEIITPAGSASTLTNLGAPGNKTGISFLALTSGPNPSGYVADSEELREIRKTTALNYKVGTSGLNNESSVENQRILVAKRTFDAINLAFLNNHLDIRPSYDEAKPLEIQLNQTLVGSHGNKAIKTIGSNASESFVANQFVFSGMSGGISNFPRTMNGKAQGNALITFTGVPSTAGAKITIATGDGLAKQTFDLAASGGGEADFETAARKLLTSIRDSALVKNGQITVSADENVSLTSESFSFNVSSVSAGRSGTPFVISSLNNVSVSGTNFSFRMHSDDNSAFALGLFDSLDPIFRKEQNEEFFEQRLKRVTFDINNIINAASATYALKSTIVGDDTLLITQDQRDSSYNSITGESGLKAPVQLSGQIDPTASTTVNGNSDTKFQSEIKVGDRILVSGETRTVQSISSDTQLTVDLAFSDNDNDTSPKVFKNTTMSQLGLSTGAKDFDFTLKNWKLISKDHKNNYFLDIPVNLRTAENNSRFISFNINEAKTREVIKFALSSNSNKEDRLFMSIKFTDIVQLSAVDKMLQGETPARNLNFDLEKDSDEVGIDFYIEKTGSSQKIRTEKKANSLEVYVNISNIVFSNTQSQKVTNAVNSFYKNLDIALKFVTHLTSLKLSANVSSSPKTVSVEEDGRITKIEIKANGNKTYSTSMLANNTRSTATLTYTTQPANGNTIKLVSVDKNSVKSTKTYLFSSSLATGTINSGRVVVRIKQNANSTYDELKLAINSNNGHNSGIPESSFILSHDKSTFSENAGSFKIQQRSFGALGNTSIVTTGGFLVDPPSSFASEPITEVDINFREDSDQFFYEKPNHALNVRSFGFGKKTNALEKFDDMSLNGPRRFQATGSITVISISGWTDSSFFRLQDVNRTRTAAPVHSENEESRVAVVNPTFVTFTCVTNSELAAKVNETNYTFGIQNVSTANDIAIRIKSAIDLAISDSTTQLGMSTSVEENVLSLRQTTGGVEGNTEIFNGAPGPLQTTHFSESDFSYSRTLDLDPTVFLTDTGDIRFPIQMNNFGLILGTEFDGVIEPFEIRQSGVDRMITEQPLYGIKGSISGNYNHNEERQSGEVITDEITFEDTKIVPFKDNCPTIGSELGLSLVSTGERQSYLDVIYVKTPGFIFKNDRKIYPFIDTEERIKQALPLEANNPDNVDNDQLVAEVFELGNPNNLLLNDTRNLGGENFRRRAGFDFSTNPHPGTDSIVFGGLIYV